MNSNLLKLASGTVIEQSNKTAASFYNVSVSYYECAECANGVEDILPTNVVVNNVLAPSGAGTGARWAASGWNIPRAAQWADFRTAWREEMEYLRQKPDSTRLQD